MLYKYNENIINIRVDNQLLILINMYNNILQLKYL